MQKNPNDRCLSGPEQQQERILVKRAANSIKKIEFEIEISRSEAERLNIDIEEKRLQISNLLIRLEKGKRLINGEKVCDVFPDPNLNEEKEEVKVISKETAEKQEVEKKKGGSKHARQV